MKKSTLFSSMLEEGRNELPFFIFLTLILIGIYTLAVASSAELRTFSRLAPLTVLMAVHIVLYWLAAWITRDNRWMLPYLAGQGGLAFILCLIGQNLAMIFGLYLGLIGITIGLLKLTRLGFSVIIFYFALSLVNYYLVVGQSQIAWWALGIIPSTAFVIIYVTLYNRRVEAQARAQALADELERANRQLAEYAAQVEDLTLANERQRMARELHDTLSQGLAGLILQLEAADAHLANSHPERARLIVQQTMERARATLGDARRAIANLRQAPEGQLDLAAALQLEAERFNEATGIPCNLAITPANSLPERLYEPVLRTVTEGLTNIARHSQADQVRLQMTIQAGWVEVTLYDNGVGFDPQTSSHQAGHYGLLGMQERARLAGGTLEIASSQGSGTTVCLRLPIA